MFEKGNFLIEREHEAHIIKSDRAYLPNETFRVTYVKQTGEKSAKLMNEENVVDLREGTILGVNELILANDALVEVRSHTGLVFRLAQKAEFSLELTVLGISPVFYGQVWKGRLGGHPKED